MSFSSLLSVLLLSSAATAAAVVNHNPATVTARAVATPRMHIERDAQGGGFEGINILGLGHLVGIDPDAQFSSIMIDGKTYPTFEVGGTVRNSFLSA